MGRTPHAATGNSSLHCENRFDPEKLLDYFGAEMTARPSPKIIAGEREFDFARRLNQLGNPVDRTECGMTPPTLTPITQQHDEIVCPAGILQPPVPSIRADYAVN